jgi:predicted secreted protein
MSVLFRCAALALAGNLLYSLPALADEPRYNQISLRAEASQEVAHDLMQVSLYTEEQDSDPAQLASRVTKTLNAALEQARQNKAVKVRLGSRNSHPIYDDKGQKITGWRERGEIRLESTDFATLSQLTGTLLASLKMGNMSFNISPVVRARSEDQLLQQAVAAFKVRAQLASEALGGHSYKIVNLNLDSGGFQPMMAQQAMRSEMAFAKSAAPEIEAGTSTVSLTANGTIEVQ